MPRRARPVPAPPPRADPPPPFRVVPARDELAGALVDLQELAERLRRDCPWDRTQTAETIRPHTVEAAYAGADAPRAAVARGRRADRGEDRPTRRRGGLRGRRRGAGGRRRQARRRARRSPLP